MGSPRMDLNMKWRRPLAQRLRRLRLGKVRVGRISAPYSLVLGDKGQEVYICLRVARVRKIRHQVTVGGRKYQYNRRVCIFNIGHSSRELKNIDVVFCLIDGESEFYCIPRSEMTGKTFNLNRSESGGVYNGKYTPRRNNYGAVQAAAKAKARDKKRREKDQEKKDQKQ